MGIRKSIIAREGYRATKTTVRAGYCVDKEKASIM